jgi:hypothetical protein
VIIRHMPGKDTPQPPKGGEIKLKKNNW